MTKAGRETEDVGVDRVPAYLPQCQLPLTLTRPPHPPFLESVLLGQEGEEHEAHYPASHPLLFGRFEAQIPNFNNRKDQLRYQSLTHVFKGTNNR